ncbi:TRAP transporter small permease [Pelagibacterium sediminicola]|uniref:TRAP transporter small permease n=1 Tax=Pelagibacterium sediminicola TaxID=2248761 RepID=UPI00130098A7|nr:TRAP transporter small permease [Pelagibacterium sediminicola]
MRILRWLDRWFEPIALTLTMGLIAMLIFLQVIMRYVFQNSLVWSEELVRWLFIWTIWIGIAYAFRTGQHIRITAFTDRLPGAMALRLERAIQVAMVVFFLWIAWLGVQQATSPIVARQSSIVMHWPLTGAKVSLTWLYMTLPFGSLLAALRLVQRLARGEPISASEA